MRRILIVAIAATTLAGCGEYYDRPGYAGDGYRGHHAPPPPGDWDAAHYYREGPNYHERRLGRDDMVYRGSDGRYYCRRSDGTAGLVVGAVAGGILGNIIAPGGSKALGTLLGAGAGAAIGNSVDRGEVRCR